MTAPEKKDHAKALVGEALGAAVRDDREAAAQAMQRLSDETGGEGVMVALIALCDTYIDLVRRAMGIPEGAPVPALARPGWINARTGRVDLNADMVPPAVRWAGQIVAARAAMDEDMFLALAMGMPGDSKECGRYVGTLLDGVALAHKQAGAAS